MDVFFFRQNKNKDAADIAYLSFYIAPNSKTEGFLVGLSHHYNVSEGTLYNTSSFKHHHHHCR